MLLSGSEFCGFQILSNDLERVASNHSDGTPVHRRVSLVPSSQYLQAGYLTVRVSSPAKAQYCARCAHYFHLNYARGCGSLEVLKLALLIITVILTPFVLTLVTHTATCLTYLCSLRHCGHLQQGRCALTFTMLTCPVLATTVRVLI